LIIKTIVFISSLLLLGCSPAGFNVAIDADKKVNESSNNFDYKSFIPAFKQFTNSILNNDTIEFNKFINEDLGLFIIEQSGAMPWFFKVRKIGSYLSPENWSFFNRQFESINLKPEVDDLPIVDCDYEKDNSAYNKTGCFVKDTNKLSSEKIWEYTEIDEAMKKEIVKAASLISISVINTFNYRYYFAQINKNWYLLFIDLRIPCSA
jgi:hypothetical protein